MKKEIIKLKEPSIWECVSENGKVRRFMVKVFRWTPNDKIKKPGRRGYARNLEQARQLKRKFEADLDRAIANRNRHTVKGFYETVFQQESNSTRSVVSAYNVGTAFEGKILPFFGAMYLDEVTVGNVNDFLHVHLNGLEVSTKQNYRKYLSAMFRSAVGRGLIKSNPVELAKPFRHGSERQETYLSPEQLKILLDFVIKNKHEWRYHFALSALTGMRVNECRGLTFGDIKWDLDLIYVQRTFDPRTGFKNYTKNFEKRYVPLNPLLKELLLQRKNSEQLTDSDFVLPQLRQWSTGEQGKVLHDLLDLLSLPKMRYYDFRASFAVAMALKDQNILKISEILGHKSVEMTGRYLRKLGVGLRGTTDCLNELLESFDEEMDAELKAQFASWLDREPKKKLKLV